MNINEYLELVQAALTEMPELNGIGVVVDMQQDIEQLKRENLAKSKGYAVIIGEVSNRNSEKEYDGPRISLKFGVTIYSPKIVKDGCASGASLRDAVIRKLHHSRLQENQHCYDQAYYLDGKTFIETEHNKARMIHATAFETDINY